MLLPSAFFPIIFPVDVSAEILDSVLVTAKLAMMVFRPPAAILLEFIAGLDVSRMVLEVVFVAGAVGSRRRGSHQRAAVVVIVVFVRGRRSRSGADDSKSVSHRTKGAWPGNEQKCSLTEETLLNCRGRRHYRRPNSVSSQFPARRTNSCLIINEIADWKVNIRMYIHVRIKRRSQHDAVTRIAEEKNHRKLFFLPFLFRRD